MRDYKNVNVPRKYRANVKPTRVKRVGVKRQAFGGDRISIGKHVRQLFPIFVAVLVFLFGWQGYRLVMQSERFQISGVDVHGASRLGEAELKAIADMFTGQNIFRVDLGAATRRALANPWVKEVRIHRSLPNRISMTLTERIPHALFDTGSNRYVLDPEGVVIVPVAKESPAGWPLPVIQIRDYRARPGEQVTHEAMGDALKCLASFHRAADGICRRM